MTDETNVTEETTVIAEATTEEISDTTAPAWLGDTTIGDIAEVTETIEEVTETITETVESATETVETAVTEAAETIENTVNETATAAATALASSAATVQETVTAVVATVAADAHVGVAAEIARLAAEIKTTKDLFVKIRNTAYIGILSCLLTKAANSITNKISK